MPFINTSKARTSENLAPDSAKNALHTFQTSLVVRRKGQEVRIAVAGQPEIDGDRQPGLIRAIARGRYWWRRLLAGDSMEDLCRHTGYTDRYIRRLLPLAFLSPRIVTQVVERPIPGGSDFGTAFRLHQAGLARSSQDPRHSTVT